MLRIWVGVILAAIGAAGAWAEETGGVKISGNANVVGVAKDVSTIAVGNDSRADVWRDWHRHALPALGTNEHLAGSPVDIINHEGRAVFP